ncbi:MAG: hypothetical protein AB7P23_02455 [Amphiplicatus sp.]
MMGNGIANVVAALIIAGAILWGNGVFGGKPEMSEEEFVKWHARAVGDIKNDIVVNCGCCGEGKPKPSF